MEVGIILLLIVVALVGRAHSFAYYKTPDGVDDAERTFVKSMRREGKSRETIREYCDHTRNKIGQPRRPGINTDIW